MLRRETTWVTVLPRGVSYAVLNYECFGYCTGSVGSSLSYFLAFSTVRTLVTIIYNKYKMIRGLILKELAANEHKPLEGFDLWGVIKETGVDDQGLCDFTSFYPYPLYKDDQLSFYKALGNRKLSLNPLSLFGTVKSMFSGNSRTKERNIEGNLVGEGLVKGGVIIFSKDGTPKYAYREVVGQELPVETILAAVHAVKKDQTA